jgi:hypothetical protein
MRLIFSDEVPENEDITGISSRIAGFPREDHFHIFPVIPITWNKVREQVISCNLKQRID